MRNVVGVLVSVKVPALPESLAVEGTNETTQLAEKQGRGLLILHGFLCCKTAVKLLCSR